MDNRKESREREAVDCSYGTSTPKKVKNSHTGWIVTACLFVIAACTVHIGSLLLGLLPAQREAGGQKPTQLTETESGERAETRIIASGSDCGEYSAPVLTFRSPDGAVQDAADTRATLSPALVRLTVEASDSSADYTGVIITESGYLLSACGDLREASAVVCRDSSGNELSAGCLGTDEATGLTLLKLNADGLTEAVFASVADASAGDAVLAVSAGGEWSEGTLTSVSAASLQSSTAALPGGRGAPLVSANGAVIGLITALPEDGQGSAMVVSSDAIGAAIDRILAQNPAAQLWLGFDVGEIPAMLVSYYGFPGTLWIRSIADPQLKEAGLSDCDIVLAADGVPICTWEEFNQALAAHSPGEQMELTIYRDGVRYSASVPVRCR